MLRDLFAGTRIQLKAGLRFRITIALLAFGATLSTVLAVAMSYAVDYMEDRYVEATLLENLDLVIETAASGADPVLPYSKAMRGYVFAKDGSASKSELARFAGLPPGIHEQDSGGREFKVAVRDQGSNRYVLTYDDAPLDRLEMILTVLLVLVVLGFSYTTLWLGYWLSGRLLDPVTSLARQVRSLGDEVRAVSLEGTWAQDEVGDLARAFERYSARLCAFIDRERAFTSDVSHELRNPIMSASATLDLVLADHELDLGIRERLARLRRAVDRMHEIVDVFLTLARESGTEEKSIGASIDVESVARSVVERHRDSATAKGLALELRKSASPSASGQASAVSIVLENLIGNAVRHTPRGRVEVMLEADRISVRDTGPGIPAEERMQVFERGFRGQHAAASGSGLGLSIVNRVCEHWGWRIEIDNHPDGGTVADLILEAQESTSGAAI